MSERERSDTRVDVERMRSELADWDVLGKDRAILFAHRLLDALAAERVRRERAEAALREIHERAEPKDWETPGHPMNEWTKREPILRLVRAALDSDTREEKP